MEIEAGVEFELGEPTLAGLLIPAQPEMESIANERERTVTTTWARGFLGTLDTPLVSPLGYNDPAE